MAEEKHQIESVRPVGRYALGVLWADRHDSLYPFANLRKLCPCEECERAGAIDREPEGESRRLTSVQRYDGSVMLRWGDSHETLFLNEELRAICGCARCKGEPDRPITGS